MIKKILLLMLSIFSFSKASDIPFEILTGDKNNTYYQIGKDIATHITPAMGMVLDVRESKGSISNLRYMVKTNEKKIVLAIVQRDTLQKYKSEHKNESKQLKVITELYKGEIHMIVRAKSPMNYFYQIRDKRINISSKKSGIALTSMSLYEDMFDHKPNRRTHLNFEDALDKLYYGDIDVVIMIVGQPIKRLQYMTKDANKYIKLLKLKKDNNKTQHYSKAIINSQSYDWNDESIDTIGIKAYLITYDYKDKKSKKILEDFADSFTKNLLHMKQLANEDRVHKKWLSVPTRLVPLPKGLEYYQVTKNIWEKNTASMCDDYQRAMGRCP